MKNALVNLIKSFGLFIWEMLKSFFTFINRSIIQDTVVPIVFGMVTMEAYKHLSYLVAPLIFLFIVTMSRNIRCSEHERWRHDHPQNREELNAAIDRALEDSPLPGVDYVTPTKPWPRR